MQAVQQGSMEAQDLARFTQSCLATLSVAYKQAKLSTEVSLYTCGSVMILPCRSKLPLQASLMCLLVCCNFQAPCWYEVHTLSALLTATPLDSPACGAFMRHIRWLSVVLALWHACD